MLRKIHAQYSRGFTKAGVSTIHPLNIASDVADTLIQKGGGIDFDLLQAMIVLQAQGHHVGFYSTSPHSLMMRMILKKALGNLADETGLSLEDQEYLQRGLLDVRDKKGAHDQYFDIIFDDMPIDWASCGQHFVPEDGGGDMGAFLTRIIANPDQDIVALARRIKAHQGAGPPMVTL